MQVRIQIQIKMCILKVGKHTLLHYKSHNIVFVVNAWTMIFTIGIMVVSVKPVLNGNPTDLAHSHTVMEHSSNYSKILKNTLPIYIIEREPHI